MVFDFVADVMTGARLDDGQFLVEVLEVADIVGVDTRGGRLAEA